MGRPSKDPSDLRETRRWKILWMWLRDSVRIAFGRLMNRLGSPGRIAPCEFTEHGNRILVRVTPLFTVVQVNGIDLYFYRWNGKYDGWGRGVCEGENPEDLMEELMGDATKLDFDLIEEDLGRWQKGESVLTAGLVARWVRPLVDEVGRCYQLLLSARCVYCGHLVEQGETQEETDVRIKAHVAVCEAHPLHAARKALESFAALAAKTARRIGAELHEKAPDPQEDLSDTAGEAIAQAILAGCCPACAESLAAVEQVAAETGNTFVGDFRCDKHRRKPAWESEEGE